ncbi:MAG: glycosyltransferase [Verrucomicrobiota bacterium]
MVPSLSDLSVATTIHNNLDRWMEMALSLEREACLPREIVVVDDGSKVPAVIKGLRTPVRLIRNDSPHGFCAASNQALNGVTTPYALLLDADITFHPRRFRRRVRVVQVAAADGLVQFPAGEQGGRARRLRRGGHPAAVGLRAGQSRGGGVVALEDQALQGRAGQPRVQSLLVAHSSSTLVRMEAFHAINGFDLRYWQCQSDNDLCLRMIKAGWQVGLDQAYTVQHDGIGGKTGGTRRVYDLYRGRQLFYETHWPQSRFYLRFLLFLRHLAETVVAFFAGKREDHLRPAFRFHLATSALRGYPR